MAQNEGSPMQGNASGELLHDNPFALMLKSSKRQCNMENVILQGDAEGRLKQLPDNSVDLIATDPPYGYSFMGKDWDKAVPSVGVWRECLRVLKPGAFAFVMSAPRSDVQAQMIVRLTEAGFRMDFTPIYWTYASGFPKAGNIGKLVDKRLGAERPVIGRRTDRSATPVSDIRGGKMHAGGPTTGVFDNSAITAPGSEEAKALEGSYAGFQPKPAVEVILVAMKPLSGKTYVDQALTNGKGVTWLDDCRVPTSETDDIHAKNPHTVRTEASEAGRNVYGSYGQVEKPYRPSQGRFPANLLVSDTILGDYSRFFDFDSWVETLPFLTVAKASKSEKDAGLSSFDDTVGDTSILNGVCSNCRKVWIDGRRIGPCCDKPQRTTAAVKRTKNHHPTVKPVKLMAYLITLASRPDDLVVDPFIGSGTTAVAAKQLGRRYIGIENDAEYLEIAKARVTAAEAPTPQLPLEA